jgi:hypothetical protein
VTGTDFGVSMRDEVLQHKLRDGARANGAYCFWTFSRGLPDGVGPGSRMWVANHGQWVGYFVVFWAGTQPGSRSEEARFYSDSFVGNRAGPRRPFMGYCLTVPKPPGER